ncbi:MAG: hypothetical protein ABJB16_18220 [Saprospiraceae bacterium]
MKPSTFLFILAVVLSSCETKKNDLGNPAEEGFDLAHSDAAAIELADSIMIEAGGRANWDKAHFISWNSENKSFTWDKQKNRVRIDDGTDNAIYLLDLSKGTGRVQVKGQELTENNALQETLKIAKSMWRNNMYWLAAPFKLKDSGITLKYLGEDTLKGNRYNVLQMTFNQEGDTSLNKYKMYVDVKQKVIRYWSFFADSSQDSASLTTSWDNYKKYGDILLSGDRSDDIGPKNIRVDNETFPDKVFTDF